MESDTKPSSLSERFWRTPWPVLTLTAVFILLNILFAERTPANMGLGWDGFRYARIAMYGLLSPEIDSYTVYRVLPSLLLYSLFHLLHIAASPSNIIFGYQLINAASVLGAVYFIKKIFDRYHVSATWQTTAFVLLLGNHWFMKFSFYYPVLTDSAGFFLGTAILYFHLQGQRLNLLLASLIAAFTWPVAFMMGFVLLLFPARDCLFQPFSKRIQALAFAITALAAAGILHYLVKVKGEFIDIPYATPIDPHLLWFSVGAAMLTYGGWTLPLLNRCFCSWQFLKQNVSIHSFLWALLLLALMLILRFSFPMVSLSDYSSISHLLKAHWIFSISKPFITLVSHFNFIGMLIPLLMLFWGRFSATASQWGIGVPLALSANLLLFGMKSESRILVNLLPWLLVLLTLALSKYRFPKSFHVAVAVFNLLLSKYWLIIDEPNMKGQMLTPKNMIGWPWQKFYMNLGIYMDEPTWLMLLFALMFSLAILALMLWKIEFRKPNLIFTPRFTVNNIQNG